MFENKKDRAVVTHSYWNLQAKEFNINRRQTWLERLKNWSR